MMKLKEKSARGEGHDRGLSRERERMEAEGLKKMRKKEGKVEEREGDGGGEEKGEMDDGLAMVGIMRLLPHSVPPAV